MKKICLWGALVLGVWECFTCSSMAEAAWSNISPGIVDVTAAVVDVRNDKRMFLSTTKGTIFQSDDSGKSWRLTATISGQNSIVHQLVYSSGLNPAVYAATGNGVYVNDGQSQRWQKLFLGRFTLESDCRTFVEAAGMLYVGTSSGLFMSSDKGKTWHKAAGALGYGRIFSVVVHPTTKNILFAASSAGIFKSSDGGLNWQLVKSLFKQNEEDDSSDALDEPEMPEDTHCDDAYLAVQQESPNAVYVISHAQVYKSLDNAVTWQPAPSVNTPGSIVSLLYQLPLGLHAITSRGVYVERQGQWIEVTSDVPVSAIRQFFYGAQGQLFICTSLGLYQKNDGFVLSQQYNERVDLEDDKQPSIKEVHRMAIEYADVSADKIILWKKQAAHSAWFPKVDVGINRDVTDLWHWESGSSTHPEDDQLRRGKDSIEWDMGLSWDLANIIWNGDQTSIDTRARLMVQLRQDILEQVTRLYFERLRLRSELAHPGQLLEKKRAEKELRIQEISALLDAYTGGRFLARCRD